MKKAILTFIAMYIAINLFSQMEDTPYTNPANWEVEFEDNFNTLDPNIWMVRHDNGRVAEWFNRENAFIENGYLKLIATKELSPFGITKSLTPILPRKGYAGAEVIKGTGFDDVGGNTSYGFYEIKCKLPKGGGFTSFWLSVKNGHPSYKAWPPEIDVFEVEHGGEHLTHTVWGINDEDSNHCHRTLPYLEIDPMPSTDPSDFYNQEHIFAVNWTPDYVDFYIDGVKVQRENYKVVDDLRMAFSFQVSKGYGINEAIGLNNPFCIDWVKYYTPVVPYPEVSTWGYAWHNNTEDYNFDAQWTTSQEDIFLAGNFIYNSALSSQKDELLIVKKIFGTTDEVGLLRYEKETDYLNKWNRLYYSSNGTFGSGWQIGVNDKFLSGNFDSNNNVDEVFIVSETKWAKLAYFNNSTNQWQSLYGNGGPVNGIAYIGQWRLGDEDEYISGNFIDDGSAPDKDELLCINYVSDYVQVYNYQAGDWVKKWTNGASGNIGAWRIGADDQYIVGDFDNDNIDELLCINNVSDYAQIYKYVNGIWTKIWTNAQSGYIGSWRIGAGDEYVSGDFDDIPGDELFFSSHSGLYSKISKFEYGGWTSKWGNNGSGHIKDWKIRHTDKYVVGDFVNDDYCTAKGLLLMVRGTDDFTMPGSKMFRSILLFSPISGFWDAPIFAAPASTTKQKVAKTDEKDKEMHCAVYPNPVNVELNIESVDSFNLSMFDISGKKVFETKISKGVNSLDFSAFENGIYVLEIHNENYRETKKIIISN